MSETMPDWAKEHFKMVHDQEWKPLIMKHALASKVLCVATTRIEGAWTAYCDAVPGMNHKDEMDAVLRHGDKMSEEIARLLFPGFSGVPYDH